MSDIILRDELTVCSDCAMVIANGTDGWGFDDNGNELGIIHARTMRAGDFVIDRDETSCITFICDACTAYVSRGSGYAAVEFGQPCPVEFVDGYVDCALWSSTDEHDAPMDNLDAELSDAARAAMQSDCDDFWASNYADLRTLDAGEAGHDFWLTRNGHGAGFWDRGLGELGERLTRASKAHGSSDLYIGDDGEIHVS